MATVTKGRTFVSGETVTPTKLNDLVDQATVTSIVDADVSASAAIALSKLATGALPTAITTTTGNIVDASVTPAKLSQPYTLATAQASTSGTSIDFTGIPSWVRRITVMLNGVSTNGTSNLQIQIGSGSVTTSGYVSNVCTPSTNFASSTNGFILTALNAAAVLYSGNAVISNIASNNWIESHSLGGTSNYPSIGGGSVSLSGTLDRIRVTTVNGTDTFDAGTINIAYE